MAGLKGKSPLVTLLVGLLTAAALLTLSARAASSDAAKRPEIATTTPPTTAPASAPATSAPAVATSAVVVPPEQPQTTYAGSTAGGAASIAIAVHNGAAIAYLCDGRRVEAWLQGAATNDVLALTGAKDASLTGSITATRATGVIIAGGKQWTFDVSAVRAPSGLYRAAADVTGAKVVGGWIVLPDGSQVGIVTINETPAPAPPLDTSTRGAVVNGQPLTAKPIDGSGL
jgi:hypothetical protein